MKSICPTPRELINDWPYGEQWMTIMASKENTAQALESVAAKIRAGTANQEHCKYLVQAMLHLTGKGPPP